MNTSEKNLSDLPLAEIATASASIAATSSRSAKIQIIAATLQPLTGEVIEVAVAFLSGEIRQGRIGIGPANLQAARNTLTAESASLSLLQVDQQLKQFAGISGKGAAQERTRRLGELFALTTRDEREFLIRLLTGELRQGALAGIMLDAIAKAAQLSPSVVRRAAMYGGQIGAVAYTALTQGSAGLAEFHLRPLTACEPMLALDAAGSETRCAIVRERRGIVRIAARCDR